MSRLLFLLVLFLSTSLFAEKNVLVLHSYHHGLQWTDNISKGIISSLENSKEKINIYFEYLDSKRHLESSFMDTTFRYFLLKHHNTSFDAIIVSDNDALLFMNQYQQELFPDKPVIFCGINNFTPELVSNLPEVTGVKEMVDYDGTLSIAMELFPKRKKVMVVLDDTLTAKKILAEVKEVEKYLNGKLDFYYFWDFDEKALSTFIKQNKDELLVYALAFNRDKKGHFFSYDESIGIIQNLFGSSIPVFGSWDFFLGKGIVGGVIISGFNQGKIAGELTLKVLQFEEANSLAIQSNIGRDGVIFDYHKMQYFSLKEPRSLLPISYINKPIDFFTQYKKVIIPMAVFICFLVVLLILREIHNRTRNKIVQELNASLEHRIALAVQESEKSEKFFRFIANNAPYIIWVIDMEYKITYINDRVKEYFHVSPEKIIGTTNFVFLEPEYLHEMLNQIDILHKDSSLDSISFEFYRQSFERYTKNYIISIYSNEGVLKGYKGIIQDITEEKLSLNLLEEAAQTDSLTGLLNRVTLEKQFFALSSEMRTKHKGLCLMMIDIDHFKNINDTAGHLLGDYVLVKLSEILKNYFRKTDLLFRYGGEEFVVLLPDISLEHALMSAEKLRKLIEQETFIDDGKATSVTISVGLSMLSLEDEMINSIIARADEALYRAKQHGRNKVEVG